ncbi:MAG: GNAT family N-acetyltransferase [bacterium]|nr:GNAT family N-acetyltransferase [bacterium]
MSALESAAGRQKARSAPRVRSEKFPAVHICGNYLYERFKVEQRNLWYLRRLAKPFEDELGYDAFRSPDEVRHNIRLGGEVIFVMPAGGLDVGRKIAVATREMRGEILVTGAVVVHKDYRRRGIATHLAEDAILRYQPIGATGRTRRWEVLRTYEALEDQGEKLVNVISPIDTYGKLSKEAQDKLPVILEPKERDHQFDPETGLYPDDALPRLLGADARGFRPPKNNPEGTRIANALKDLGVLPEKGNAVRYWIEFNQDVLKKASDAYRPIQVVVFPAGTRPNRLIAAIFGLPLFAFIQPSLASFKK